MIESQRGLDVHKQVGASKEPPSRTAELDSSEQKRMRLEQIKESLTQLREELKNGKHLFEPGILATIQEQLAEGYVMVDVDGVLLSTMDNSEGARTVNPQALEALKKLAGEMPVILWSSSSTNRLHNDEIVPDAIRSLATLVIGRENYSTDITDMNQTRLEAMQDVYPEENWFYTDRLMKNKLSRVLMKTPWLDESEVNIFARRNKQRQKHPWLLSSKAIIIEDGAINLYADSFPNRIIPQSSDTTLSVHLKPGSDSSEAGEGWGYRYVVCDVLGYDSTHDVSTSSVETPAYSAAQEHKVFSPQVADMVLAQWQQIQ